MIPKITPPGLLTLFTGCVAKSIAIPLLIFKLLLSVFAILFSAIKALDDMYVPYCYYEYEPLELADIKYCDVAAKDVAISGDYLTSGEAVVKHRDLIQEAYDKANRRNSSYPLNRSLKESGYTGNIAEHVIPIDDNNEITNPTNGAVVCRDEAFTLKLMSFYSLKDSESWVFFSSSDTVVNQYQSKTVRNPKGYTGDCMRLDKYRIHLHHKANMGHVQFIQSARGGARYSRNTYPWGTLLNLYIYRDYSGGLKHKCYPSILPVVPLGRQSFVPLVPSQRMQLIVPSTYRVTFTPDEKTVPPLRYTLKTRSNFSDFRLNHFDCVRPVEASPQLIFFEAKDSPRQGSVIIPPIFPTDHGDYAILHEPMDDVVIYCNNISGFILRLSEDRLNIGQRKSGWLDYGRSLLIESGYRLKVPDTGYNAYDLQVRIMDNSKSILKIKDLFNSNGCTTL